jgi:hypothetical protein
MGAAVVLDNLGVIDRNEIGLPIEFPPGIAQGDHYIGDQRIGSPKRPRWGVDKLGCTWRQSSS